MYETIAREKVLLKMPEAALMALANAARSGGGDSPDLRRLRGLAWNSVGVARARERDSLDAAAAFDRALLFAPDEPEIHFNTGLLAFEALGEFHRAERHLREALRLRPEYTEAFSALATLLAHQGRWAEAEAAWREVLTRDPGNREARQGLATAARAR